ncbi:hypothetical protein HD554DRAFT_1989411, partial [Boletus coccyginus]
PPTLRHKIKWFNADMTMTYKETEVMNLIGSNMWGLCTTFSFGMEFDIPDIQLQCFGYAVRDKKLDGTAILFAEKNYFDNEQIVKATRRKKHE